MENHLPFWLRASIFGIGMGLWLGLFFSINNLGARRSTSYNFSIRQDKNIPFVPQFFLIYLSAYVFVSIPFFIIPEYRAFTKLLLCYVIVTLISASIHLTLPSRVQRVESINPVGFSGKLMYWFQKLCKPHGNFPSVHTGYAVIIVISLYLNSGSIWGISALVWATLIIISTLVTKQHYILDISSGFIIGIVAIIFSWVATNMFIS